MMKNKLAIIFGLLLVFQGCLLFAQEDHGALKINEKITNEMPSDGSHRFSLDLSEFTGAYYSDELSTRYELIIEDGNLVARHQRNSDIKLTPVKEDVFSGDAWFFGQTEFVRDGTHAITGCNVSSGRVRNLYFRKMD